MLRNSDSQPTRHLSMNAFARYAAPAFAAVLAAALAAASAHAQVPTHITGPYLWVVAPTKDGEGGPKSANLDQLAAATDGAVTEEGVAMNGAQPGDQVGDYAWAEGILQDHPDDNVNQAVREAGVTERRGLDDFSAYALINLEAPYAQKNVLLACGSDDSVKIWLNGEVVHNNPVNRAHYGAIDRYTDLTRVNLRAGSNRLLAKVGERSGHWDMSLSVNADFTAGGVQYGRNPEFDPTPPPNTGSFADIHRAELLDGFAWPFLNTDNSMSSLCVVGERAFPVVAYDFGGLYAPAVAAAAPPGEGRAVAFGEYGESRMTTGARRLWLNAVRWTSNGRTGPVAIIRHLPDSLNLTGYYDTHLMANGIQAVEAASVSELGDLSGYAAVLIPYPYRGLTMSASDIQALNSYRKSGGGLVVFSFGGPWGAGYTTGNRLFGELGIFWGTHNNATADQLGWDSVNGTHVMSALRVLNSSASSEEERNQANALVEFALRSIPRSEETYRPQIERLRSGEHTFFTLQLHQGPNLIHVPVDDETIQRSSDLFQKIDQGRGIVTAVISLNLEQRLVAYTGGPVGSKVDLPIEDSTAVLVLMKQGAAVSFIGGALSETTSLNAGINMIGIPRSGAIANASEIAAPDAELTTVAVIRGEDAYARFSIVSPDNDVPIAGGQGFIVFASNDAMTTFAGGQWWNEGSFTAPLDLRAPESTPLIVVEGSVARADGIAPLNGIEVSVTNVRTGQTVSDTVGLNAGNGRFSMTMLDLQGGQYEPSDLFEVQAADPSGRFGGFPNARVLLTKEDIANGRLDLGQLRMSAVPKSSALLPNYPNPFNPETWIPFELSEASRVTVTIYSSSGETVRVLELGNLPAGTYSSRSKAARWDGRNALGEPVSSGLYFYRIETDSYSALRRMAVVK